MTIVDILNSDGFALTVTFIFLGFIAWILKP